MTRYGMNSPDRYSSGRWSVRPAAFVVVSLLWAVAGFGFGTVVGRAREHDRGAGYCSTYATMTGTTTRYAAGECWVQYPESPGYWAPLTEPQGAR